MSDGGHQAEQAASAARKHSAAVTRVAVLAAVGGLLFGYDTGVISGAAEMIEDRFGLSDLGFEIVVSAVLVGAAIGAATAGALAKRIGRRPAIMIAAVILFIGMAIAPESPRYLIATGKVDAGRRVLSTLIPRDEVEETIGDLQRQLDRAKQVDWREILSPSIRGVLLIGAVLAAVQQFTGINTIIYYDVEIFARAGFDTNADAVAASIIVGFVNMAATLIAIRFVDRLGRKPLLISGLIGMTTGLVLRGVAFFFEGSLSATVSLIAMLVYIPSFAASLGPVVWVLIGEIYPQRVREPAMSFALMVNWISNFVVALTFLSLLDALGASLTFFLYAGIAVLSILFILAKVPETKGRSLEEIADETGAALEAEEDPDNPLPRRGVRFGFVEDVEPGACGTLGSPSPSGDGASRVGLHELAPTR